MPCTAITSGAQRVWPVIAGLPRTSTKETKSLKRRYYQPVQWATQVVTKWSEWVHIHEYGSCKYDHEHSWVMWQTRNVCGLVKTIPIPILPPAFFPILAYLSLYYPSTSPIYPRCRNLIFNYRLRHRVWYMGIYEKSKNEHCNSSRNARETCSFIHDIYVFFSMKRYW